MDRTAGETSVMDSSERRTPQARVPDPGRRSLGIRAAGSGGPGLGDEDFPPFSNPVFSPHMWPLIRAGLISLSVMVLAVALLIGGAVAAFT